jgi:hypothetical protein
MQLGRIIWTCVGDLNAYAHFVPEADKEAAEVFGAVFAVASQTDNRFYCALPAREMWA